MNNILRAALGAILAATLVAGPALAIEYEEIFQMSADGATDEEIVRLIVEDGRGFELTATELEDLRSAGVSDFVIDVMQDPELGRRWLSGEDVEPYADPSPAPYDDGGYSTSLDEAYKQGYSDGQQSTGLVFSFGYYYGPLARYYYVDPFYYSFWWGGYGLAYWPSYYAYWYRPVYPAYYAYPYNYYTYDSYYCHTYYDPGYWTASGYTVLPGYGRTVWDDGPRWRDGGVAPVKGGRPDAATQLTTRLRDGGTYRSRNPGGPPAIREALATRDGSRSRGSQTIADLTTPSKNRTPSSRSVGDVLRGRSGQRTERGARVERSTVARGGDAARTPRNSMRDVSKGRVIRTSPEGVARSERGTTARRERAATNRSGGPRAEVRRETPREIVSRSRSEAPTRSRGRDQARAGGGDRLEARAATPERVNVIRGNRETAPRMDRRSAMEDRVRVVRGNDGARRLAVGRDGGGSAAPRQAPRVQADRGGSRERGGRVEQAPAPRPQSAPAPAARNDGGGRGHGGGDRGGNRGGGHGVGRAMGGARGR